MFEKYTNSAAFWINAAPLSGCTFPSMQGGKNKTSSRGFPGFQTQLVLFIFSFLYCSSLTRFVSFFPFLSLTLILLLMTRFEPAGLAAAPSQLPSGGPFVGSALGGIKRGASHSPPLPPSLFLWSSQLFQPSLFGKGRDSESAKLFRQASLLCLLWPSSPPSPSIQPLLPSRPSSLVTKWKELEPSVWECSSGSGCDVTRWHFLLYPCGRFNKRSNICLLHLHHYEAFRQDFLLWREGKSHG